MTSAVVRGPLLPADFVRHELARQFGGRLGEGSVARAHVQLQRWWPRARATLGPATAVRAVAEVGAVPLFSLLGLQAGPVRVHQANRHATLTLRAHRRHPVGAMVTTWNADLDVAWRVAVRDGLELGAGWCLVFNGPTLRLIDSRRTFARFYAEIDLASCVVDLEAFGVLWGLVRAEAFARRPCRRVGRIVGEVALLDEIVAAALRHGVGVSAELQHGVRLALGLLARALAPGAPAASTDRGTPAPVPEQALTLVYRILFLLYAEARLLVPIWHPVYRQSYSIEAIRDAIARDEPPVGLWETLQGISRLAHRGCQVESLRVAPFNGRLFAPGRTPLGERARVEPTIVRNVVAALTLRPAKDGSGQRRIDFGDLGVEQLGAIYERVLDDLPDAMRPAETTAAGKPRADLRSRVRKATGTFYTPRSITDFIVRRTLHPLVDERSPDEILAIRVLDPAMGSGALLVAACRYLATAYEHALVGAGHCRPGDLDAAARAGFRRTVAQRCLFGVDVNPMAVQLARLSLWLATLAVDLPLTFLDHHLREGNSLVGASPADVARQAPGFTRARRSPTRDLPLFDEQALDEAMGAVVPARLRLALDPDDSADTVRAKERLLDEIQGDSGPLGTWKRIADLWCASWFWGPDTDRPPAGAFPDLSAALRGEQPALPARTVARWLDTGRHIARSVGCFHWLLEFPEVFTSIGQAAAVGPGFDAVVANPPWDMVRADTGSSAERETERARVERLQRFARESGVYRDLGEGHVNRYQLFVERGLSLLRANGRFGFLAPWGVAVDQGSRRLRRTLFERCDTDTLVALDNRRGIFPIHRSVRFALVTGTTGRPTRSIRARLGEEDAGALDTLPDHGGDTDAFPVRVSLTLLRTVARDELAVPCVRNGSDVAVLERICATHPTLGSAAGWAARFGRELNATDDRRYFSVTHDGPLVVEGKHISPFSVDLGAASLRLDASRADRRFDASRSHGRARLAYRDVASSANRLTLIAAVLPVGTISTHTLLCLKSPLPMEAQWTLCALLNSFVANWLVRLWVTTHVGVSLMERLPVPRPAGGDPRGVELASLAEALARSRLLTGGTHARLQALAAQCYGLTGDELARVLASFPLVPQIERDRVAQAFHHLQDVRGWHE